LFLIFGFVINFVFNELVYAIPLMLEYNSLLMV